MCFISFIINGYLYRVAVMRVPYANCKANIKAQVDYLNYLYYKKVLTKSESDYILTMLAKYQIHCSHGTINVFKQCFKTGEIQHYSFAITSSYKDVIIVPSLSELELGEMAKTFNVIKIKEGLYITSHSISNHWDLQSKQLRYDEDKGCYIETTTGKYNEFDITKKDMEKIFNIIVNRIESTEGVKKIDITSNGDLRNDVVSFKLLEKIKSGDFDKKNHQEIGKEIDLVNDTFTKLEKEYGKFEKLKEPFDE